MVGAGCVGSLKYSYLLKQCQDAQRGGISAGSPYGETHPGACKGITLLRAIVRPWNGFH